LQMEIVALAGCDENADYIRIVTCESSSTQNEQNILIDVIQAP